MIVNRFPVRAMLPWLYFPYPHQHPIYSINARLNPIISFQVETKSTRSVRPPRAFRAILEARRPFPIHRLYHYHNIGDSDEKTIDMASLGKQQ